MRDLAVVNSQLRFVHDSKAPTRLIMITSCFKTRACRSPTGISVHEMVSNSQEAQSALPEAVCRASFVGDLEPDDRQETPSGSRSDTGTASRRYCASMQHGTEGAVEANLKAIQRATRRCPARLKQVVELTAEGDPSPSPAADPDFTCLRAIRQLTSSSPAFVRRPPRRLWKGLRSPPGRSPQAFGLRP